MLTTVVREGTGRNAGVDGYTIAGKTGTGQKLLADGNYGDEAGERRYTATFAGFFPTEDPQLSMIVVIDEPLTNFYASQAAAPLFAELAKYSLQRLRIAPPADVVTVPPKLAPAPMPQATPAPTSVVGPTPGSEPAAEPAESPPGPDGSAAGIEPQGLGAPEQAGGEPSLAEGGP